MDKVLTKQHCAASNTCDMVGLMFGEHRLAMFYQTAIKIAAGLRQSAKLAARYEGVRADKWDGAIKAHLHNYHEDTPFHREYRRSEHRPNFSKWSVGHSGNLVWLKFDELTVRIHYENAFELYGWLRNEAQKAKRWAGDGGRQWSGRAHLTDAEENDKIVYVQ
jgi:hypothetical protein